MKKFLLISFFTILTSATAMTRIQSPMVNVPNTQEIQKELNAFISNGQLHIRDYRGAVNVQVYDLIGRKLMERDYEVSANFAQYLTLETSQMVLVRIQTTQGSKTIKALL